MLRCHPPSQESVDTQFSNNTCASAHGGAKPTSGPASSCRNSLQRGVALPQIQEPAPLPLPRNAQHNTGRAGPLFPATQGAIVKAFSPQWRGSLRVQGSEHNIITTYFEAQGLLTRKHAVKGLGATRGTTEYNMKVDQCKVRKKAAAARPCEFSFRDLTARKEEHIRGGGSFLADTWIARLGQWLRCLAKMRSSSEAETKVRARVADNSLCPCVVLKALWNVGAMCGGVHLFEAEVPRTSSLPHTRADLLCTAQ